MDKQTNQINSKIFVFAGVMLAVVVIANLVLISIYHSRSNKIYTDANNATYYLRQMDEELLTVNRNLLMIISDAGNKEELAQSIENSFSNISYYEDLYSKVEGRSEREKYRYSNAITFLNAYKRKFEDRRTNLDALNTNLYIQELHPLQTTATEMFNATIDINTENTQQQLRNISLLFAVILGVIVLMFLIGEAVIMLTARTLKKQEARMLKREREFAELEQRLSVRSRKVGEISSTNILTGLKNRYALIADLDNIKNKSDVDVAIFNIDKFRNINDNFGYNYGDEYLTSISKTLKEKFGASAEIYNYTSNSFCFVFKKSVENLKQTATNILVTFQEKQNVGNLVLQPTATGCYAHYEKGKISDVDKMIIEMEKPIREAKNNGGNQVVEL